MDYSALKWLEPTPRIVEGEIEDKLDEIHPRPMFAGFRKAAAQEWRKEVSSGVLVMAGVVQASAALFDPAEAASGAGVFVWSRDPRYSRNASWVATIAERLRALRDQPTSDPELSRLGALLADEQSSFYEELPASITDGVQATWSVGYVNDWDLPDGAIPQSRVLPGFVLPNGTLKFIPSKLYGREKAR